MRRLSLCVLCVMALAGATVAAQAEQQPQPKPASAPRTEPGTQSGKVPTSSDNEQTQQRGPQIANVRLEVTIVDQRSSGQPTTKTVSLVLADRAEGRIRTTGEVRVPPGNIRPVVLNVDAHPVFTRDGRVRAHVTLEYKPVAGEATTEEQALTTISETFAVILDDGKPLVVSQSADPTTDRRVRVEVKATILK
jgi:hypothetical protein